MALAQWGTGTNIAQSSLNLAEMAKKKAAAAIAAKNTIPAAPQSTPIQFTPTTYKPIFERTGTAEGYTASTYKAPQLENTVQPAYNQMRSNTMTAGKQSMQSGLEMARDMMGKRNIQGGVANMAGNAQVDAAQRNTLSEMSDLNLQEARDMSELAKTQATLDMQAEEMNSKSRQFAAALAESQYKVDNDLANLDREMDYEEWSTGRKIDQDERELRRQEIVTQYEIDAALRKEKYDAEMAPYALLMQMYGTNAGQQTGSSSNGSQGVLGTIGSIGSAASLLCLPKGTMIELESTAKISVENVFVGMKVKGGEVIAKVQIKRPPKHCFCEHVFETGTVVMTLGHPYFDNLMQGPPLPVDNPSECTYDILTDSGHYYVNGVKLGSTLAR